MPTWRRLGRRVGGRKVQRSRSGASASNQETLVLAYSAEDRGFETLSVDIRSQPERVTLGRPHEKNPIDQARRALAASVGGPKKIRAYVLFRSPTRPTYSVEQVVVRHAEPGEQITPELVESGYAARTWFEYKSPRFLAHERRLK